MLPSLHKTIAYKVYLLLLFVLQFAAGLAGVAYIAALVS